MIKALEILTTWAKKPTQSILSLMSSFELVYLFFALSILQALTFYMLSFSPGQGLVEHIFVDISWNYGWKLCEK